MNRIDKATEEKLSSVYPELASRWRMVAQKMWDAHRVIIRVTDGLREFEEQLKVWSKGRVKGAGGKWYISDIKKVVTHAMPGQSYHQYGLAIDSCFQGSDPFLEKIDRKDATLLWNAYGRFCKEVGLEWGGEWVGSKNDRPHCQLSYGLNILSLNCLYEEGGIESVWNKCKALANCGSALV
jgi:peptidoglycan L-alanyl-D-glutamate endopeptidase CwlK